jgi:hypothetical protein
LDYFNRWKEIAWSNQNTQFMHKTIGVQASFDVLKILATKYGLDKNKIISDLDKVNISELGELQISFSGIGRTQIKNKILEQLNIQS